MDRRVSPFRAVAVAMSLLVMTFSSTFSEPAGSAGTRGSFEPYPLAHTSHLDGSGELVSDGRTVWQHLSTETGDLPSPGTSQQTSALIFDVDNDGVNDFVIGSRQMAPSVTWYRHHGDGWTRHVIDNNILPLEAGGAFYDITGNGALDLIIGEDASGNKLYWWENPHPNHDPNVPWTRRVIKNSGSPKHHDQIFGDFTGDGKPELVFWNQRAAALFLAEIPADPRNTQPWPMTQIFSYGLAETEMEGLASGDINGDGKLDIVGGGRWFEHTGGHNFVAHVIDDQLRNGTVAVGDLTENGRLDVVFSAGDWVGPLRWYEQVSGGWIAHDLLGHTIDHGHSLEIADFDEDGHLDIFVAEMRLDGGNEDAGMWIFYGDGKGNFSRADVAIGIGNHESKVGDLNGDGRVDILGKPYNWDTPRLDVWLNLGRVDEVELPLDRWQRHVIDDSKPWRSLFITAADINGNGRQDIVTGGWWYENPGVGGASWVRHTIGDPLNNMAAVFDFDGDGHLDILGTKGKGSDSNAEFVWARNNGNGTFTIHDNIEQAEGDFLQGVAVDRFQGGRLGIALSWHDAGYGVQMLTVPDNPLTGTWTWERISTLSLGEDLSAGDIDRDGRRDLLLGTVWLRNDGSSWSAHTLHGLNDNADRNHLVDMNGDGRLDAVIGYEAISHVTKLAWYEQGNIATNPWTEHVIANIVGPMSLDVRDMNNDGALDVIAGEHNLADPNSAALYIFENADGRGGEWIEHVVSVGDEHHMGAQVADIYGDGDLDIISIGWDHSRVLLYENRALSSVQNRHLPPPPPPPPPPPIPLPDDGRVTAGIQALYTFDEGAGSIVRDVSGVGSAVDLQIADQGAVSWGSGSLTINSSVLVASSGPATKLFDAFRGSNALTVEAWITPASASQSGPARIVTMTDGLWDRNLTVGQGDPSGTAGSQFDVRLRTTATSANGQPSVTSAAGTASNQLSHLVYTRTAFGDARIYLNGVQIALGTVGGDFSNWNGPHRLGIANEFGAERPWLGTYHLVAFYDRALGDAEITRNFQQGPDGAVSDPPSDPPDDPPDPPGQVEWVAPAEGAILAGVSFLVIQAPDGAGRVEFAFEGGSTSGAIGTAHGAGADGVWSVDWDTSAVPDGSYQLIARAFDAPSGGNMTAEASRSVVVRNDPGNRIADGLVALYDFGEGGGDVVRDVSGVGAPLDLQIENPATVGWGDGSLTLGSANRLASSGPPQKVIDAAQASEALTLEAWISPVTAVQSGPGRVATISNGAWDRNLTLAHGQPDGSGGARYEARLRSTSTTPNGVPSLVSPVDSAAASLQHVVFTRDAAGVTRLYIDGVVVVSGTTSGTLANWDASYRLGLGNEFGVERPWLGTYHLVAIYGRALSQGEVEANFAAGPNVD